MITSGLGCSSLLECLPVCTCIWLNPTTEKIFLDYFYVIPELAVKSKHFKCKRVHIFTVIAKCMPMCVCLSVCCERESGGRSHCVMLFGLELHI